LGADPAAYIVSSNLKRRNLKKGQQAMALAMIYPTPEKGGRGKKKTREDTSILFSDKLLQQCRAVLAHSQALAVEVIADRMPLDSAIKQMQRERDLKTGQKAMWYAFAHRERYKDRRGKSSLNREHFGVSEGRAANLRSSARKVLDHSEALAHDVLADRSAACSSVPRNKLSA
jgi:hypothetical protein